MEPPFDLLRPRRRITGMSAVLLPFTAGGDVDWPAFEAHLRRTAEAGLVPAVNMDTGYVHLVGDATRTEVVRRTSALLAGTDFVAGAAVVDAPGDPFDFERLAAEVDRVAQAGGTPILFPSHGSSGLPEPELVEAHREVARRCDRFLGFELGPAFVPFGRILSLDAWAALLEIDQCVGAKHSSLSRELEWDRLRLRDQRRPDFMVLTGNDLAIDMVMYGSDYLLGLSTFAPDLFAERDRWWHQGDARFFERNDLLQYLGMFAFRPPVPAYRHSAAQFLAIRGWLPADHAPEGALRRPDTDRDVLAELAGRLGVGP